MTPEQYATLPNELTLREVRVRVMQKGFRTKCLVVVTTLIDVDSYPPRRSLFCIDDDGKLNFI